MNWRNWPYSTANGERLYVIGDIHGEFKALQTVLNGISDHLKKFPSKDYRLIFLGDTIDRGEYSRKVIDCLIALARTEPATILMGNHEAILVSALENPDRILEWRNYGGLETLTSFGIRINHLMKGRGIAQVSKEFNERFGLERRKFIQNLPYHAVSGDYFFCHAGIRPGRALSEQLPNDLIWIREPFLSHRERYEKCVVHGHTPVERIDVTHNRINIDTGAYLTQRLTCLILQNYSVTYFDSVQPEISSIV